MNSVDAYRKVLQLARRQGDAVRAGDLDTLSMLMAEREHFFGALQPDLSDRSDSERQEIAHLIREILTVDGDNAILLKLLMEETLREVAHLEAGKKGSTAYFNTMAGALSGHDALDETI